MKRELNVKKTELDSIERLDVDLMTSHLWNQLLGTRSPREKRVIDTSDDFQTVILEDLFQNLQKDDVIRIILSVDLLSEETLYNEDIQSIMNPIDTSECNLRILLFGEERPNLDDKTLFLPIKNICDNFKVKYIQKEENTYRFISKNREKLVFIMTDSLIPDKAVLMDRTENSMMIDNAIDTFDYMYSKAQPIDM
jgi:hypothetical protein